MNRQHGYKGEVAADPSGPAGTTPLPIASLNAWSLDATRDRSDVTAFQDPNKVYVQGVPDLKGTLGGWWDTDDVTLFDIAMGDLACALRLTPSTLTPTYLWKGPAFLDAGIDVKANGGIAIKGSYVAAGAWSREPVSP